MQICTARNERVADAKVVRFRKRCKASPAMRRRRSAPASHRRGVQMFPGRAGCVPWALEDGDRRGLAGSGSGWPLGSRYLKSFKLFFFLLKVSGFMLWHLRLQRSHWSIPLTSCLSTDYPYPYPWVKFPAFCLWSLHWRHRPLPALSRSFTSTSTSVARRFETLFPLSHRRRRLVRVIILHRRACRLFYKPQLQPIRVPTTSTYLY